MPSLPFDMQVWLLLRELCTEVLKDRFVVTMPILPDQDRECSDALRLAGCSG